MSEPLAYFLTWTTYGTWLPGDRRRWVDRKESGPGVEYQPPDVDRLVRARAQMHEPAVRLSEAQRSAVDSAIRQTCHFKRWPVLSLKVLSNHVHLVVRADGISPERTMSTLKAWASRRLNDALGQPRDRWWTRHGSTRYINDEKYLLRAIRYVQDQ